LSYKIIVESKGKGKREVASSAPRQTERYLDVIQFSSVLGLDLDKWLIFGNPMEQKDKGLVLNLEGKKKELI
jgi:hypothetical protein